MDETATTEHPDGGTLYWFRIGERVFSVLGDGYPYADDYELQERSYVPEDITQGYVLPDTEHRFETLGEAEEWIQT